MRVVGLSSSPRRDGNSRLLTQAVLHGAAGAGHDTHFVELSDSVRGLLRDCRVCRDEHGRCTIDDGYEELLLGTVLSADALVLGTPLYWYGVSSTLKTFIDRLFCYISAGFGDSADVRARLVGKRVAVVVSAEERYEGALIGVRATMQEFARYLHWRLVGIEVGVGNRRGEVRRDPADPIGRAEVMGARMFDIEPTDYRIDSERSGTVWGTGDDEHP